MRKKKRRQREKTMLKEWCRAGINNTHHILPRCRNSGDYGNTVRIDIQTHQAFHFIFGLMTFGEVAEILLEIERLVKENPNERYNFNHFFTLKNSPRKLDERRRDMRRRFFKKCPTCGNPMVKGKNFYRCINESCKTRILRIESEEEFEKIARK